MCIDRGAGLDSGKMAIYDDGMNTWVAAAIAIVGRLPIEKWVFRPPDRSKQLHELETILTRVGAAQEQPHPTITKVTVEPVNENTEAPFKLEPRRLPAPKRTTATNRETIDYQNREIGKLLLRMERHLAQKFHIMGKACDCGQTKHLLDLESLCEETIPMVNEPGTYYQVLEWVKDIGPKCSVDAVESGRYDNDYPRFAQQARDFRKELLGTVESSAMFPKKEPDTAPIEKAEPEDKRILDYDDRMEVGKQ